MNQDDISISLHADLEGAIHQFINCYSKGPMGIKRTNSRSSASSCLSTVSGISTSTSSMNNEEVLVHVSIDTDRACSDARMIVDQIDQQIPHSHGASYHRPSPAVLLDLIVTLCRGTFLFPPNDEDDQRSNDNNLSLITIIDDHLPIRGLDNIILEYLDSGVHGYISNASQPAWTVTLT
jgi:hypothetical protein